MHEKEIIITGSAWTIITDVKFDKYDEFVNRVIQHASMISNKLNKIMSDNSPRGTIVQELENRLNYENNRITSITRPLLRQLYDIKQLTSDEPGNWSSQRFRRFILVPGVGKILKFLTGAADVDDINMLNNKIENLDNAQKDIAHQVHLQASILNTMHSDQINANNLLVNVSHYAYEVGIALRNVQEIINNQSATRENILSAINQFDRLTEQITDLILDCHNMLNKLNREINQLLKGHLPWSIISPSRFISFLKEICTHIPSDWHVMTPSSSSVLWTYYNKAKIVVIPMRNGLRMFVSVPLLSPRSNFDVFHIIPFPTPAQNTSHHIVALFENPFIAITKDREYYLLQNNADFEFCLDLPSQVCTNRKPILSITKSPSCELALWLRDNVMINKMCTFGMSLRSSPALIEIKPHTWLYHLPQQLDIILHCKQPNLTITMQTMSLSTSGTLYVPPWCSSTCPYFVIPRVLFGNTHSNARAPEFFPLNVSEIGPLVAQIPIEKLIALPPITLTNTSFNRGNVIPVRELTIVEQSISPNNPLPLHTFSLSFSIFSFIFCVACIKFVHSMYVMVTSLRSTVSELKNEIAAMPAQETPQRIAHIEELIMEIRQRISLRSPEEATQRTN